MPKIAAPAERQSARERLLAAAEELFYEEGFNTVGIDRVIERAGVAKASLYDCFGSKEELVRSYLQARHEARKARVEAALARHDTARRKLLGLFDHLAKSFEDPTYRGCAFVKAHVEARADSPINAVVDASRLWLRDLIVGLTKASGAKEPKRLAKQLVLLYDGAAVSARMDRDPGAAVTARAIAETLLDAAGAVR